MRGDFFFDTVAFKQQFVVLIIIRFLVDFTVEAHIKQRVNTTFDPGQFLFKPPRFRIPESDFLLFGSRQVNADLFDDVGGDFNRIQNITDLIVDVFKRDINAPMTFGRPTNDILEYFFLDFDRADFVRVRAMDQTAIRKRLFPVFKRFASGTFKDALTGVKSFFADKRRINVGVELPFDQHFAVIERIAKDRQNAGHLQFPP